jgi:hypothetical protein
MSCLASIMSLLAVSLACHTLTPSGLSVGIGWSFFVASFLSVPPVRVCLTAYHLRDACFAWIDGMLDSLILHVSDGGISW